MAFIKAVGKLCLGISKIINYRIYLVLGRYFLVIFALLLIVAGTPAATHSAELVMIESDSCEWCEIWHEVIGPIYPKTAEGRFAPLRRIDIADDLPKDLSKLHPASFTPTFILIENGKEVSRILGYPGEDFFWGLLEEALVKIGFKPNS